LIPLNNARKAFDRFDKPGASWIPLIVFSCIGIVGTAACVHLVSQISDPPAIQNQQVSDQDVQDSVALPEVDAAVSNQSDFSQGAASHE
tara:strand:+ start:454223 stop:454489 length:267 start_codon:yes stop_codon:yes gene_type:complete